MSTTTLHRPEHVEVQLNDLQLEQAKKAATIGEFRDGFKQEAMLVMAEGDPETAKLVQSRIDVVATATKDHAALALGKTEANVLGYAKLGGGTGGVVMSEQYFGTVTTLDNAEQMLHAGDHELRHAVQAVPQGDIVFQNNVVDTLHVVEGDAELAANAKRKMAATEHREGQPEEVYAAGQNVAYAIQQVVGKQLWNEVLTETGDTQALQEALNKAGQGVRGREPAQVG